MSYVREWIHYWALHARVAYWQAYLKNLFLFVSVHLSVCVFFPFNPLMSSVLCPPLSVHPLLHLNYCLLIDCWGCRIIIYPVVMMSCNVYFTRISINPTFPRHRLVWFDSWYWYSKIHDWILSGIFFSLTGFPSPIVLPSTGVKMPCGCGGGFQFS